MNKEQLLGLGLSEEHTEAVLTAIENSKMIPYARFTEVNEAKKALEEQVSDYSKQLTDLKSSVKGNEEFEAQIAALQKAQQDSKAQYEQQLKDSKVDSAIKLALAGKVHDADLVASLFDRASIVVDDNHKVISGLDEQLGTLKESKSFLFVPEKQEPQAPQIKGANPINSAPPVANPTQKSVGSQFAARMNQATQPTVGTWGQ